MRWIPILGAWVAASLAGAATFEEDFTSDPFGHGWQVFGDTNLFNWNATNQNLEVTWDSSQSNSYFFRSVGTILARDDDFSLAFDLTLWDIASGSEPGKTGGFEIAIGFLNLETATGVNFLRGVFGGAPNLVEFDYFPPGYFPDFGPVAATTTPVCISSSGLKFAPKVYAPYEFELPANQTAHVMLSYTASNQTLVTVVTIDGVGLGPLPEVVLTNSSVSTFRAGDDFRVNVVSINSYSSSGDDYDSVLAHGTVNNLTVIAPPPPVQSLSGSFRDGVWEAQFFNRTNWLYTLERTVDLGSWSDVSAAVAGNGTNLVLRDENPPPGNAFYRVRANRP